MKLHLTFKKLMISVMFLDTEWDMRERERVRELEDREWKCREQNEGIAPDFIQKEGLAPLVSAKCMQQERMEG